MKLIRAFITLCVIGTVTSSSPFALGKDSYWSGLYKTLHWEGKINGDAVEMNITAGAFVKDNHKVEGPEGSYTLVDGYTAHHANIRNGEMPPHITTWTVRWGGKELKLSKGIYTSIFTPHLDGPKANFDDAHLTGQVWIGPSEDGEELLVTMNCGSDGSSDLIAFTIEKDGKMRRFRMACRS